MSKKSFLKFLFFLFLVLNLLSFGQFVSAQEPRAGETQNCGDCGFQTFQCDEQDENDCGWSDCEAKSATQDCGDCGVQACECQTATACDWGNCDEATDPKTRKTRDWDEYRCQGREEEAINCGQEYIEKQECSKYKTRTCTCNEDRSWDCPDWSTIGWSATSCDDEELEEECDLDWELCFGGTSWTTTKTDRSCDCAGTCLEEPQETPTYYNNPNYPTNPYEPQESEKENSNNIFLPVKLYWEDVRWWQLEDGPKSYSIQFNGNTVDGVLEESEFIPQACFLKSDTNYSWKVSPCCGTDENNCKPWEEIDPWNFTTNSAPEPVLPADPDWKDPEGTEDVLIPVDFEWCEAEEAQSYFIQIYKNEEVYWPDVVTKEDGTLNTSITLGLESLTKSTNYSWEVAFCFNEDGTDCGTSCDGNQYGDECGDYGQRWNFTTSDRISIHTPEREVPFYNPDNPDEIPVVNLLDSLEWKSVLEARSYRYEIKKYGEIIIDSNTTSLSESLSSVNSLWDSTDDLDKIYTWRVKSCWDNDGKECEESWSEPLWKFKTTGAPPNVLNADTTIIPVKLDWEDIDKALSYKYELIDVLTDEIAAQGPVVSLVGETPPSEILVGYPNLKQEKTYSWQIKTCADKEGEERHCGDWSNPQEFTTFELEIPSNPSPGDGDNLFTYQKSLSWDSVFGAKFYQYKVDYEGTEKIPPTIISTNSLFFPTEQLELGNYTWHVRACLDKDCNEPGKWSDWSFTLVQPTPQAKFGFVPCGRSSDNPDTPWNERESCQFKHIFILLRNILDFLLWRVTLIILLLLVIATAMIFYFSIGAPAMIIDIRGVWRAAGKGYVIIFISWTIISLILRILGFTMGPWWMLPF